MTPFLWFCDLNSQNFAPAAQDYATPQPPICGLRVALIPKIPLVKGNRETSSKRAVLMFSMIKNVIFRACGGEYPSPHRLGIMISGKQI